VKDKAADAGELFDGENGRRHTPRQRVVGLDRDGAGARAMLGNIDSEDKQVRV
jgi:hypothetical protein